MVIEKYSGVVDFIKQGIFAAILLQYCRHQELTRLLICLKTWFIFFLEIRIQPKSLFTAFLRKQEIILSALRW